jgi:microcystin degradation protein MlrC
MRCLVAGLFHETHTFLDRPVPESDFLWKEDGELLGVAGDSSPLGGAFAEMTALGWEIAPVADARAIPGGMAADFVWRRFAERMRRTLRNEDREKVSAIFLVLHGAMVTDGCIDVEGALLELIRTTPGWEDVPIFGVLDLHANVSPAMTEHSTALLAYRENPHTDARETAIRAVRLMDRAVRENLPLCTTWRGLPLIWTPPGTGTVSDPMRALEKLARRFEEDESILAVNVFAGFAYADTPHTGVSFSVVHIDEERAEAVLAALAEEAWRQRQAGVVIGLPAASAVDRALAAVGHPWVLAEASDNIGAGTMGDGTGLLRALLEAEAPSALVCMCDAAAVEALQAAVPGEKSRLTLGGSSRFDTGPLTIEATFVSRSSGRFALLDRQSHLASVVGDRFDMGLCAVVRAEGVTILLTSRPTLPMDLGQWLSQGLDPSDFKIVGIKAAVAHRRAFDPIAAGHLLVETPGPCAGDLRTLPFRHRQRPVYPLNEISLPEAAFAHA